MNATLKTDVKSALTSIGVCIAMLALQYAMTVIAVDINHVAGWIIYIIISIETIPVLLMAALASIVMPFIVITHAITGKEE